MTKLSKPVRTCERWRNEQGWQLEVLGEGEEGWNGSGSRSRVGYAEGSGKPGPLTDWPRPRRDQREPANQAGRGDAQPISGLSSAGASSFASTPGASPRARVRGGGDEGQSDAPQAAASRRAPPGSTGLRARPLLLKGLDGLGRPGSGAGGGAGRPGAVRAEL